MNTVRLQEVLSQRYNTHLTGLRNKILTCGVKGPPCSYYNHLSSRPVGQTMQKTLKAKIQNAINLASSNDVDSPAVFVGGRRRNRKKRKNKNGQVKRKGGRKGGVTCTDTPPARVSTPPTPDSAYEELLPIYSVKRPVVSCLDIREPVFYDHVTSPTSGYEEERDSVYNSNDSLVSLTSGHDGAVQHDDVTQTTKDHLAAEGNTKNMHFLNNFEGTTRMKALVYVPEVRKLGGLPRTNSEDSGVYSAVYDDDSAGEDAGYGGELTDDTADDIADDTEQQITDDAFENSIISDECFVEVFKDDDPVIEIDEELDEPEEKDPDEFDEIDLDEDQLAVKQDSNDTNEGRLKENKDEHQTETAEEAVEKETLEVTVDEDNEPVVFEEEGLDNIRNVTNISEAVSFVNFVQPEDEDEIIFDLSQLEVNNTKDDFSKIPNSNSIAKLSEVLDAPTGLEEGLSFRVPMDLLIDDDEHDEVLFEAKSRDKKGPCITCNPLYEHALKEEEESLSIKSFQGGFKTDFDNINLIQIPTVASSKTSVKPLKESSPLIGRRQEGRDGDDELACCVIL